VDNTRDVGAAAALFEERGDRVGQQARTLKTAEQATVLVEAFNRHRDSPSARPFGFDARPVIAPLLVDHRYPHRPARRDAC
jgi:hypothetical protein